MSDNVNVLSVTLYSRWIKYQIVREQLFPLCLSSVCVRESASTISRHWKGLCVAFSCHSCDLLASNTFVRALIRKKPLLNLLINTESRLFLDPTESSWCLLYKGHNWLQNSWVYYILHPKNELGNFPQWMGESFIRPWVCLQQFTKFQLSVHSTQKFRTSKITAQAFF